MKRKLGEICRIVSGSTPNTGIPEYWGGNLKWVTPAELDDKSRAINDTKRTITGLGATKTGLTPLPAGTVLLSSRAPIGKVAITDCEMYCNQGFKNLICSDSINNKYLYWFLKGKTRYLNSLGRGATFKEISKKIVADIEINLPDIEEQEKIVNRIGKIDSRLFMLRAEISRLDELIKARFVEMFNGNYEEVGLSELGKISTGSTPSMKNKDFYENTDTPFYKPGDFIDGVSNIDCSESFIDARAESISKIMNPGTVAVTCIGIIGKIGIIKRRGICNQQINFITPNDNVNSTYLAYAIDTKKRFMQEKANAPVVPILNKTNFSKVTIPFAPVKLQNQFATFVAQVDKSKFTLQNSIISLMNLWYNINQYVCERMYGEA